MFSKHLRNVLNSVRVRLTLSLAAVFFVCTVAAFAFMYNGLEAALLRSVDETLREEVEECTALFAENGVEGVKEELRLEEISHDRKEIFFRVVNRAGDVLADSARGRWEPQLKTLDRRPVRVPERADMPYFETLLGEPDGNDMRVIHARLAPDVIVQVFHGLNANSYLLADVHTLFLSVLAVLLLMSVAGTWFALSRTMAGVEAVTQAALDIEAGDLRRRVAIDHGGREIQRLAGAFNTMLDKVAALVVALRQVSDDIAHELRSPIARIRGTAEMAVLQSHHGDVWQEAAGSIVEDCDDLLALVNGMLDLAEMQAGLSVAGEDVVDLSQLIHDTCELFTPAAEDAGITLEAENLPPFSVRGDEQKLRHVFANIIDNAIKYTPEGGNIGVSATVSDGSATVSVQDTGVGIDPDDLPHVFERFYRADRSRTRGGKGLGLGIARAIVALHRGQINVTSQVGKGTCFMLSFPTEVSTPTASATNGVARPPA